MCGVRKDPPVTHSIPAPALPVATRTLIAEADAFLLDFNGTLSDDEQLLAELVAEISEQELGVAVSAARYFAEFAGFTEEHMFGVLAAEASGQAPSAEYLFDRFNARYLERTAAHSTITPAARAFIASATAAGKRLAVVTAASRQTVVPALEQAGIGAAFETVVALEDVASSKPDPECYLRAAAELGIEPIRAVAFEDSRTGIRAARGAGVPTVAVLGSLDLAAASELTPHVVTRLDPALL
ncbi:HAD family phosphatase [Leucobacter chromiireducens subsp. chromiireducens]|uniref:HAD family phosphatase n=1 Tax=Leucobacter chromiireducens subsp. chromiireducens TaxID=660067 RepID=A0ABS1SP55_9MICO|nr:HAD family phosphatase [Leucobacter chromiireducens subsp. chromiireducens]